MGLIINGEWRDQGYDTDSNEGEFQRQETTFRRWIGVSDSGSETESFPAASGRYHLFVSYACPWAHRTLIMRRLKNLEKVIGVTVVDPKMLENGWEFTGDDEHNPLRGLDYLYQVYMKADPDYEGTATVPILWDKENETIVNNESADILRILNSAFDDFNEVEEDYYPESLREEIDEVNELVYENINNGVYKAGFATTQKAYEKAYKALFEALDTVEERLSGQRFLTGPDITEADWRLFTTLVRFDPVYYSHFKANRQRIVDFPNLSNYLRDLYQHGKVAETVHLDHIKTHYYYSHKSINPTQIIPRGPAVDHSRPHDRDRFC